MLTLQQLLKADPSLAYLNEQELEQLRNELYEQAQLAFDVYWTRKNTSSKNPIGSFTNSPISGIVNTCNSKKKKQA